MYKLLIVDDEEEVRHGIVKKIDWERFDFQVVGEAENGREALDIIEDNVPDIIITDINMPLMNGLELAAAVKTDYPMVKMVILTGFDDFKFAQAAIKHDVSDYVLKPVLPKDLNELLGRLKTQLDSEFEDKKDRSKLEQHYFESLPILKDNFLTSLIIGNPKSSEIEAKIRIFDLNISGSSFAAAVINLDEKSSGSAAVHEKSGDLMKFAVLNIAQEILGKYSVGAAFFYGNTPVVIAGMDEQDKTVACNRLFSLLEEIRQAVQKYLSLTVTIGLGDIYDSVNQMKESYKSASTALEYKLVLGGNKVIYAGDIEPGKTSAIVLDEEMEARLVSSIKFGDEETVTSAVNMLFDDLQGAAASIDEYQLYFMEIFTVVSKLSRTYQLDIMDILPESYNMYMQINNFNTMDEVKGWIENVSRELMNRISSKRMSATQKLLEKAKDYINSNYGDTQLSIQKLADHLFISSSYLSLIFKKEAQETFLKYLIRVRLGAAKSLLKEPNVKITEVAEKVGYPDVSYFSYFFKKNFGVSPREYKNTALNGQEPTK
ncbi:MAG: response regulator [Clostridia bacterium]|nr:response regulator [Clostridia bacterium]MBT7121597.1 response regulator [Clostridia bacterium]